ncbi:uncharacterized protein KLLA0_E13993g [Kluyveromyces lactis]|uniref:KLLA0E13993p n=1 Tax=Kluyveromyces lactis (strain ATCC 8585 / CBS 2359 / DSM 70799 / NBRC 1267 / NRRL Y-1140 / WM37) TaxID=284590 RepID=Q6CNA7_KLULA|nr:uncharacterized protein KLLA0_E13993g [Kluyveromyces lactis]CAG99669.1 KLLA0E13993p [Kluyveromyces lactis]|eukprot:XP_454582.1 uncharacterized protein KLLA0_E13993g [Kluyveromyces lactis]
MVQMEQDYEVKAEQEFQGQGQHSGQPQHENIVDFEFGDNDAVSNSSGNDSNSSSASKKRRKNQGVACCFCKRRRKRCDGGFPQCGACVNAGIQCTFVDKITGRELPRDYIDRLESKVFDLESKLRSTEEDKTIIKLVVGSQLKMNISQDLGSIQENSDSDSTLLRPSYDTAVKLLQLYRIRIHRQYPFLDWPWVLDCFHKVFMLNTKDTKAISFVYLVLSIGVDLGEVVEGAHPSSLYYGITMDHINSTLEAGSIRTIQLYLLLIIQLLVKPKESLSDDYNQLWLLAGVAVRTAVSLDLHRKPGSPRSMTHGLEQHVLQNLRSRVFWCAYSIERLIGMTVGRPFCISDVDIDAPLPESELEVGSTLGSADCETHMYANAIEIFKLRRIQSSICMFVYGPRKFLDNDDEINQSRQQIILELEDWKQGFSSQKSNKDMNFISTDTWANMNYHQSVVWFLRPVLLQINDSHRKAVADGVAMVTPTRETLEWFQVLMYSASEISTCYENILKESLSPLSHNIDPLTSIHTLFVAGVTYMYCIWLNVKLDLISGDRNDSVRSINVIKLYQKLLQTLAKQWHIGKLQYESFMQLSGKILINIQRNGSSRFHSTNNLDPIDKSTLINDPTSDCESTSSLQSFAKNLNDKHQQPNAIKDSPIFSFINLNGDTVLRALIWDLLEQFE